MGVLEILLLGLSLAMDSFAVTISNAFAYPNLPKRKGIWMPIAFGAFQGLMPVLGYLLGSLISGAISQVAGIVTFVILALVGVNMIREGRSTSEEAREGALLTPKTLLLQAVATSIDALAVGVSFAALAVDITFAASLIAVVTFVCCLVALAIGRTFGRRIGNNATIIGGVVLILIGIKALF